MARPPIALVPEGVLRHGDHVSYFAQDDFESSRLDHTVRCAPIREGQVMIVLISPSFQMSINVAERDCLTTAAGLQGMLEESTGETAEVCVRSETWGTRATFCWSTTGTAFAVTARSACISPEKHL